MKQNEHADNRRHHWVPVSYLRPWQDIPGDKGLVEVERVENGQVVARFKKRPERILWKQGYYDMSQIPEPLSVVPSSLLESGIFAAAMEACYLRIRSSTLDCGKIPTVSQAAFFAECCMTLYYRCPRFQRMADRFSEVVATNEGEKKILQHHAVRALTLTVGGAMEITKHCLFHFVEASGEARFWTTDTPCWMWHKTGHEWKPTSDLAALEQKIQQGQTSTRWLCPITPRFVLEICPLVKKEQVLQHSVVSEIEVHEYNRAITLVADEIRVCPPKTA